jgi:hypothetical protein
MIFPEGDSEPVFLVFRGFRIIHGIGGLFWCEASSEC